VSVVWRFGSGVVVTAAPLVETWCDDDDFVSVYASEPDWRPILAPSGSASDLYRRAGERNGRYVDPDGLERWRGVLGFTEAECDLFAVRALPGASPRLAAYVGRLSDGPTVVWAWWVAHCLVTGAPQRFAEPDRGDRGVWCSRKLPGQVADRVRRLRSDRRPLGAFSVAE